MLQLLGLELRRSPFTSGQKRQTGVTGGPRGGHGGGAQWSLSSSLGLDLNSRSNARLLNQEVWIVPKTSASEGRGWEQNPGPPTGPLLGWGVGNRKDAPWPLPSPASRAKSSRKPSPGGDHPGADGEHRPLCPKGKCTMSAPLTSDPHSPGPPVRKRLLLTQACRPPSSCWAEARDRDRALAIMEASLAFYRCVIFLIGEHWPQLALVAKS